MNTIPEREKQNERKNEFTHRCKQKTELISNAVTNM